MNKKIKIKIISLAIVIVLVPALIVMAIFLWKTSETENIPRNEPLMNFPEGGMQKKQTKTADSLPEEEKCSFDKVNFGIKELDESGFIGQAGGKTSVSYEFCIPFAEKYLQQIKSIDSSIDCFHGSSGRIGCMKSEYLCLGDTGMKDFKTILCEISNIEAVKKIQQNFWE